MHCQLKHDQRTCYPVSVQIILIVETVQEEPSVSCCKACDFLSQSFFYAANIKHTRNEFGFIDKILFFLITSSSQC